MPRIRSHVLTTTLRIIATLMLVVTGILGSITPVGAQNGFSDVAILTTENGQSAFDACYVIVDYSEVGCDENGDGRVMFSQIPWGVYTVHQTADLGPNRSVADFTIDVRGNINSAGYEAFSAVIVSTGSSSGSASSSRGMSNIAIVTTENGQPAYDACYIIGDYSDEGCDENGDGKITFEEIPYGTYTVHQTRDLGAGRSVSDFSITVAGNASADGWERFPATITNTGSSSRTTTRSSSGSGGGANDISLIIRDPDDSSIVVPGACFVLLDYSNEGCDENSDGQVTFDDMPAGTFTVHQTRTPAGYETANDFAITIDGTYPSVAVGYIVKQAAVQSAPGTRNVEVVFVDSHTLTKIVPAPMCVTIGDVSVEGCDRVLVDGQIGFLDLQTGTFPLAFTGVPAGWQIVDGATATISPGDGPQIHFVLVDTGNGGSSSTTGSTGNTGNATDMGSIEVTGGSQTTTTTTTTRGGNGPGTSAGIAVEVILDTSDSMNDAESGGKAKIDVAKDVAARLVTETLLEGVPMALRTYDNCSSTLSIPMQPLDPNAATATISGLRASGKTPIEQSLRAAGRDLANVSGPKIIVLITDGDETCSGDPLDAIQDLVANDVTVQVNIVGFDINNAALDRTFREWAAAGNGTYYQASDEIQLHEAVTSASQLAFQVLDANGQVVASGTVGGGPVPCPAGTYTVEINTSPVTRFENVTVTAGETSSIDLDSGATNTTTSTGGRTDGTTSTTSAGSSGSSGTSGTSGTTADEGWTSTIVVVACDTPTTVMYDCRGIEGVVVNIALASGEWLGSCTSSRPMGTPWGGAISNCSVKNLPLNADIVATQDPSTLPAGYTPVEEAIALHVGSVPPVGFEEFTFGFINVPTGGSSGTTSTTSSGSGSGEYTITMTFRACPEGFDPGTGDFYTECTIPLDAPDASVILWGGDGQGGMNITQLQRRDYDGAYIYTSSQGTGVTLSGLAPVVRDAYQVFGADSTSGGSYIVHPAPGETREVFIFYYYSS